MRLIDADALKQDLLKRGFYPAIVKCALEAAPTIEHGRWVAANDGTHFCSECGYDAPYTWDDIDRFFINSADDVPDRISNHCPHCGAKMDGEADDT